MKIMSYNLNYLSDIKKKEIEIDLAAASVAFKERNNLDVLAEAIENKQPEEMRVFFKKRLKYYRIVSIKIKNNC